MKKIINISLWALFLVGTIVTLGFVQKEQSRMAANKLDITVNAADRNYFITTDDVRQLLIDKGDSIVHQSLSTINIPELEALISNDPSVDKADVCVSVNGEVRIVASQRKPVARIFTVTGESYYIDKDGKLMPWSANYTADVVPVTGFITESYGNYYRHRVTEVEVFSPVKQYSVLDDIYHLANFISLDSCRKALVGQIYVNAEREFELVPSVGNFKIVFGDTKDMDEKFNKLILFYRDGLRNTGEWNKYSVINLKYKNQIVCTKRI